MRLLTIFALGITMGVAFLRRGEAAHLRGMSLARAAVEDFPPHRLYPEFSIIRNPVIRADDSFDDYGHLRFGRSDD